MCGWCAPRLCLCLPLIQFSNSSVCLFASRQSQKRKKERPCCQSQTEFCLCGGGIIHKILKVWWWMDWNRVIIFIQGMEEPSTISSPPSMQANNVVGCVQKCGQNTHHIQLHHQCIRNFVHKYMEFPTWVHSLQKHDFFSEKKLTILHKYIVCVFCMFDGNSLWKRSIFL